MAMETANELWPPVGNPSPPSSNLPNDNPEWEMILDDDNDENANSTSTAANNNRRVLILPSETVSRGTGRSAPSRPRSATIGGEANAPNIKSNIIRAPSSGGISIASNSSKNSLPKSPRRTLRRCASTPDLLVSDSAHEVIVEDESDEEDYANTDSRSSSEEEEDDLELIEAEDNANLGEESFEVLSEKNHYYDTATGVQDDDDEPIMIDKENEEDAESATLVSAPSVGTSSWTMAGSSAAAAPTSVWGMKKSPSFKDILAKNIDTTTTSAAGVFGKDKTVTEAKLRDSHRRHHLRVRTKPKFIIVTEDGESGGAKKMMKHAHSTGDLTKMLSAVQEGHESSGVGGYHHRNNRRMKKQLSAMMEEDEEGDFIIGRGDGSGNGGDGGGGMCCEGDVMGDTDAMDYYHRKDHGSKSTSNKKKERPDEAKRREIIMHKKEMQRKKQMASQKGGGGGGGGGGKKKKNDKGYGGKKEKRKL